MNNILFPPNFFEVGDAGVLSLVESIQESNVTDMVNYIHNNLEEPIPIGTFEQLMRDFQVEYPLLPQYLKDKLDTIDIA